MHTYGYMHFGRFSLDLCVCYNITGKILSTIASLLPLPAYCSICVYGVGAVNVINLLLLLSRVLVWIVRWNVFGQDVY